jgi:hypothetical protein
MTRIGERSGDGREAAGPVENERREHKPLVRRSCFEIQMGLCSRRSSLDQRGSAAPPDVSASRSAARNISALSIRVIRVVDNKDMPGTFAVRIDTPQGGVDITVVFDRT